MAKKIFTDEGDYYCSECGAFTIPDADSCARCDALFEGEVSGRKCESCGAIGLSTDAACSKCKKSFEAKPAAPKGEEKEGFFISPEDEEFLTKLLNWGQKAEQK